MYTVHWKTIYNLNTEIKTYVLHCKFEFNKYMLLQQCLINKSIFCVLILTKIYCTNHLLQQPIPVRAKTKKHFHSFKATMISVPISVKLNDYILKNSGNIIINKSALDKTRLIQRHQHIENLHVSFNFNLTISFTKIARF